MRAFCQRQEVPNGLCPQVRWVVFLGYIEPEPDERDGVPNDARVAASAATVDASVGNSRRIAFTSADRALCAHVTDRRCEGDLAGVL